MLDDDSLKGLMGGFSSFEVGETYESVITNVGSKLTSLTTEQIRKILSALVSIVNIFEEADRNIDVFTSNFTKAFAIASKNADFDSINQFESNLTSLLSVYDKIRITSKSQSLILENSNNFNEARIVSDVRFVFDKDLDDANKYAVLIHNLKIEYTKNDDRRSFFVSMDFSDLIEMKKLIDRAIEKDKIIRKNEHNFNVIDIK